METETAKMVELIITAVGGLAWLLGFWFVSSTARRKVGADQRLLAEFPYFAGASVLGEAEVEGQAEELSRKAASTLARSGAPPFGMVKVLEEGKDKVVFERTQGMGVGIKRGQVRLLGAGSRRTRVVYALEVAGKRGLLLAGWICLALGLVALGAGYFVIMTYVVPHPDPAVRYQTWQGAQVVHLLWPPFLFAGIYRKMLTLVRTQFDTLIHNLPFG